MILQYEDTPLLEVVREQAAGYTTQFSIYHHDGTYLAKLKGSQLYATEAGKKAGLVLRHPPLKTICELNGSPIIVLSIPEISKCRQLIVVTTEDWNAISATIQLFERNCRVGRRPGKKWESRFPALSVAVDSHGALACMEPEKQERQRENGKAMKPPQPVFSGYSPSSAWRTRLKFASSGFLTSRSPRQRKQSMILSPGTTIALLTGRQLHTPTGRVRNRCCALAGLTGAA